MVKINSFSGPLQKSEIFFIETQSLPETPKYHVEALVNHL